MGHCTELSCDGTFKVAPKLFKQLFTINGDILVSLLPLVYGLLPGKSTPTYTKFIEEVKFLCTDFDPVRLMCDFELSFINSSLTVFPEISVTGCFFHFTQSIWRKFQGMGNQLVSRYKNDTEFSIIVRMLPALAFVPLIDVSLAFGLLRVYILERELMLNELLEYFEIYYIGNEYRDPRFHPEIWNQLGRNEDELCRTNNSVKGWHRGISTTLGVSDPTIWEFLDALKRRMMMQNVEIEQLIAGISPIGQRRKWRHLDLRI